jgi:hypothetical protein
MEANFVANVDMLVNESELFIKKRNKERVEKLVTIPSSHSRNKNNMEGIACTKS